MPRARWPNVDLDQPAELQDELDHIAQWAASLWRERSGGNGTRGFHDFQNDVTIHLTIDPEKPFLEPCCAELARGNAATPGWVAHTRKRSWTPISGTGKRAPSHRHSSEMTKTFVVPEPVLMESPVLSHFRRRVEESRDPDKRTFRVELGPIHRRVQLFPAVVALLKLRWLVRLHHALNSYAGQHCNLLRYLKGVLADSESAHVFPHPSTSHFDSITNALRLRFGTAWPYFLAYVAMSGQLPQLNSSKGQPAPSSWPKLTKQTTKPIQKGITVASLDEIDQVVDDIWVAWMAQQKGADLPTEAVLDELEYFQMRRPVIRLSLDSLFRWTQTPSPNKHKYLQAAKLEAHHLALLLDTPSLWTDLGHSREDILDMAGQVVANPRTFNTGVCARIISAIDESSHVSETKAPVPSLAKTVHDEHVTRLHSTLCSLREKGPLRPDKLEALRSHNCWLVGGVSRHQDVSSFHERGLRPEFASVVPIPAPRPGIGVSGMLPTLDVRMKISSATQTLRRWA